MQFPYQIRLNSPYGAHLVIESRGAGDLLHGMVGRDG